MTGSNLHHTKPSLICFGRTSLVAAACAEVGQLLFKLLGILLIIFLVDTKQSLLHAGPWERVDLVQPPEETWYVVAP